MIGVSISEHAHADHEELTKLREQVSILALVTPSLSHLEKALQDLGYEVGHQKGRGVEELIVLKNGPSLASIILKKLAQPATT